VALKGGPELRARLKAIRQSFKPIGKGWATDTAKYAKGHVPRKTGRLQQSIRVRNATQRKATVVGHFSANFVDAGTKQHDITPRKKQALAYGQGQRTVFAKKVHHPRTRAQPFKRAAAQDGLRRNPLAEAVIKQWNDAVR
jgi:hypothetical protein